MALTPVQRGVLTILMAQGKPVKQADFEKMHGLAVKKQHRQKLAELELIKVEDKPHITYALTKKGWAWLSEELTASKPKGSMGLGPLYAALSAIDRLTKRLSVSLEEALSEDQRPGGKVGEPRDEYIREAAWADADASLARALQDISVFTSAIDKLKQAANGTAGAEIKRTEQSAKLVFQSVRQAATQRELSLTEEPGSEVTFDPSVLESDDDTIKEGQRVRIRKSAVIRGHGTGRIIIRQGLAEALRIET